MSRRRPLIGRRYAAAAISFLLIVATAGLGVGGAGAATAETVGDDFESDSFSGTTGSLPWETDWLESGESNGPSTGLVEVITEPHCASGSCLILGRASSPASASVEREADLRGASAATLTFDRKRHRHPSGSGQVTLEVSNNGGTGWSALQTWPLDTTDAIPVPELFDISGFATKDTRIRFAVTGNSDSSHFNVDNLLISLTIEDPPPADWYLKGTGVPSAVLGGPPVATVLPNYDPLRDADPGLLLEKSGLGLAEPDGTKYQFWATPAQWHELDGPVDLVLWSTMKSFNTGVRGVVDAGLYDCTPSGTGCALLAQSQLDLADWNGGNATWVERVIDFGTVTASIAPDRALGVKLVVDTTSGDDMWLAYDTIAYPSRVRIGTTTNQPPALDPVGPQSGPEGLPIAFTATASDPDGGDTLAFTLTDGTDAVPAGASIGPSSGDFTWTPTEAQGPGTYRFKARVTDDGTPNLYAEEEITFTVTEVNETPTLDPIGPQAGAEQTLIAFTATASDPDVPGNGLSFSLAGIVPAGAAIDPVSGAFTWTPSEAQGPGAFVFDVVVTDDGAPAEQAAETITVTVSEANAAPVADLIVDQFADELTLVNLTATATDSDLPADALTWSLVSGPGSVSTGGVYTWTPTEADGPTAPTVTLRVTDDGSPVLWDEVTFTVTVAEVNLAPSLADPGPQANGEDDVVSIFVAATDADLPANGLTWSALGLPPGLTINTGTGEITGTISASAAVGSPYSSQVSIVDDGSPVEGDSVPFTWVVTDTNHSPVLDPIGPQSGTEQTAINFTATASDSDLPAETLTFSLAGTVPTGATIGAGSGLFDWTPTEAQGPGVYTFDVAVTDDGVPPLAASETITVTVAEFNDPPVLNSIGPQSGAEGTTIAFSASGIDADLPANGLTYSLSGAVPAGASMDPVTGAFTWPTSEADGGATYVFDVVVGDDGSPPKFDFETVAVTVGEVNVAPTLDPIGPQAGPEDTAITFVATAGDSDLPADTLAFSLTGAVPAGAAIDPATGAFLWTPTEAQGPGLYTFDVVVTDDGSPPLAASETITVTISEQNLAPSLAPIADPAGDENTTITFTAAATDPDLPANAITYSLGGAVPAGAVIDPVTGAFSWTPTEIHGPGTYTIDVLATDDGAPNLADSLTVTITVNEANSAPGAVGPGDQISGEGDSVSLFVAASDPDVPANALTWSALGLPPGLTIDPGTGEISGIVDPLAATGSPYAASVTVTDDGIPPLPDVVGFQWTVVDTNRSPSLAPIGPQAGDEGTNITFTALASDPDFDGLTFALTGAVPAGAAINPLTGLFSWTPGEAQGPQIHTFDVVATDDGTPPLTATETIAVAVAEVNTSPVLSPIGAQAGAEGIPVAFVASGSDGDLPANGLSFSLAGPVPAGAAINPATGAFTWTPAETDGGTTAVFDVVLSDDGTPPLAAIETIAVTVAETNLPPFVAPIGTQSVDEGSTLTFVATASDLDVPADGVSFSLAGPPPAGAIIDPVSGVFSWTPGEADGPGLFTLDVVATDDGSPPLAGTRSVTVTVGEVNEAPLLASIDPQSGAEGTLIAFTASATDADLPANGISFALSGAVPAGAAIDPVTGVFAWTPTEGQGPGAFAFDVVATDDGSPPLSAAETITVSVTEANAPPALDPIGQVTGSEGTLIAFDATATDPDQPPGTLTYSLGGTPPTGAAIDPATGRFEWTPTEGHGPGTFTFDVSVNDDGVPPLSDSQTVTMMVTEVNEAPVLTPIGALASAEGGTVTFTAVATDSDQPGNQLAFSLDNAAPAEASIDPATGEFTWTPTEEHGPGVHTFAVVVIDDGVPPLSASQPVTITIEEVNAPPSLDPVAPQTAAEGLPLSFVVTATDPDEPANLLGFVLDGPVPTGATITAAGQFSWVPSEAQGPGSYTFDVVVIDDASPAMSDRATLSITVAEVNQPPELAPIPAAEGRVGSPITFTVSATDPDWPANPLVFSLGSDAPADATLDPAGGQFQWTPTGPAGTYTFEMLVTDRGEPPLSDTATVAITVGAAPTSPGASGAGPSSPVPPPPPPPVLSPAVAPIVPPRPATLPQRPPDDAEATSPPAVVVQPPTDQPETPSTAPDSTAAAAAARKQTLIGAITNLPTADAFPSDNGVRRSLVLMARAGLGTAATLGSPLGMLLGAMALVATIGRIGLVPILRRRKRVQGVVQWFDAERGFGLILPDGGDEQVFAHISVVSRRERTLILPGRRVTYGMMPGSKRAIATRVRLNE